MRFRLGFAKAAVPTDVIAAAKRNYSEAANTMTILPETTIGIKKTQLTRVGKN